MYRKIIRPILFIFPPEWIHRAVARLLPFFLAIPGVRPLVRRSFVNTHGSLERKVFGLTFQNPVGVAAGFDKEAGLYNALADFGFSHVEIGTITPEGQKGNPKPRLFRLPQDQALINRMGFNNEGVDACIARLRKKDPKLIIGGNIGKNTNTPNEKAADDYCVCFEKLFALVDYFVINISCPNIKNLEKLQDKEETLKILKAIQTINKQKPSPKPILLKIAPDLTDNQLDEVLEIVNEADLQGIVATNTSPHRDDLCTSQKKVDSMGSGGLSGKPLRHKSTKTIAYLHHKSGGQVPIIGVGGILSPDDAMEKIHAGAALVQIYTGFIYAGPAIAKDINQHVLTHA